MQVFLRKAVLCLMPSLCIPWHYDSRVGKNNCGFNTLGASCRLSWLNCLGKQHIALRAPKKCHGVFTDAASIVAFYFSQLWMIQYQSVCVYIYVCIYLYVSHTVLTFCKLDVYKFKTFKYVNLYLNGKLPTMSTSVLHKGNTLISCVQESFSVKILLSDTAAISRQWNAISLTAWVFASHLWWERKSFITWINSERLKT